MPSWIELPLVKPVLESRLQDLTASFSEYVEVFQLRCPFAASQLRVHLKALRQRATFASPAEAVCDRAFADTIREVLIQWGVGTRGAELVPSGVFAAELRKLAPNLAEPGRAQIQDFALDLRQVASMIWRLINSMCLVTKNGQPISNKLVSGSKALHHVLPALVFPIDREYTQTFFGWHNPEFQYNPRACFDVAFLALAETARKVKPDQFVGEGWMSNPTKILDNAIVGFCIKHGLQSENTRHQQKKRGEYKRLVKRAKELRIWDTIRADAENASRVPAGLEPRDFVALERAADRRDLHSFLAALQTVNWRERTAEELVKATRYALSLGAFAVAQRLAEVGERLHGEDPAIKRLARMLAPAKVLRANLPPDPRVLQDHEWLKKHASEYRKRWVALENGKLLVSGDSIADVRSKLGDRKGVLLMRIP
jgi:hypothetical protein